MKKNKKGNAVLRGNTGTDGVCYILGSYYSQVQYSQAGIL